MPVMASFKNLLDGKVKWEVVSTRLIAEVKSLTTEMGSASPSNAANIEKLQCHICQKWKHSTENLFLNPLGKKRKVDVPEKLLANLHDGRLAESARSNRGNCRTGRGGFRPQERSANSNRDLYSKEEYADTKMI